MDRNAMGLIAVSCRASFRPELSRRIAGNVSRKIPFPTVTNVRGAVFRIPILRVAKKSRIDLHKYIFVCVIFKVIQRNSAQG